MPTPILLSVNEVFEKSPGTQERPTWINPGFTGIANKITSTQARTDGAPMQICEIRDSMGSKVISMTLFKCDRAPFKEGDEIEVWGAVRRTEYRGLQQVTIGQDTEIHVVRQSATPKSAPLAEPKKPAQAGLLDLDAPSSRMMEIAIEGAVKIAIHNMVPGRSIVPDLKDEVTGIAAKILAAARQLSADQNTPF